MTRETLRSMIDDGSDFVLLDVRGHLAYHREHIPRSVSMPSGRIGPHALPGCAREIRVIIYCSDFDDRASAEAAERLMRLGFSDVWEFKGGLADWKAAGYPTERGS